MSEADVAEAKEEVMEESTEAVVKEVEGDDDDDEDEDEDEDEAMV